MRHPSSPRDPVTRYTGLLLLLVLVIAGILLRTQSRHRSHRLLDGEKHARAMVERLYEASIEFTRRREAHPGLAQLAEDLPELETLTDAGAGEQSYARDDVYVYGITTTATGTARPSYGFILRAWPRDFGVTGDHEFYVTEEGAFWEGVNERGRSGLRYGFPPPFPDPAVGNSRNSWYRLPQR